MNQSERTDKVAESYSSPIHLEGAFSKQDERTDMEFYSTDRFVSHLDALALKTIKKIIRDLVIEESPVMLDLMAGWDSHLPENLNPSKMVGLGLNENELKANEALTEIVIHDINQDSRLPFSDSIFDVVINTVSVDYMVHPIRVFQEVGRILKPGGLFLVIFSNRMFPEKAVNVWKRSSEDERVLLVDEFFRKCKQFDATQLFVSLKKARPQDDKYARLGMPSDPVYAVYAEKKGGVPSRKKRPHVTISYGERLDGETLQQRQENVETTRQCPYCEERLKKWAVPDNPFCQTWDNEYMYICFNDECPYFVRGWDRMYDQTNQSISYRLMYNPVKERCSPIPVPTPHALRDGILEED